MRRRKAAPQNRIVHAHHRKHQAHAIVVHASGKQHQRRMEAKQQHHKAFCFFRQFKLLCNPQKEPENKQRADKRDDLDRLLQHIRIGNKKRAKLHPQCAQIMVQRRMVELINTRRVKIRQLPVFI